MVEIVLNVLSAIGVVAFSVAGALVAIDHRVDMFGVVTLAAITSFGGGLTRDLLMGKLPPTLFTDRFYLVLAGVSVLTALVVFTVARVFQQKFVEREKLIDRITNIFDAVAIGVFATTGAKTVMDFTGTPENAFLVLTLGSLTAVGGSIIRDVLICEVPFVLKKRIYVLAVLAGAGLYYLLVRLGTAEIPALVAGTLLTFGLRMMATIFRWNLPRALP
ncbi:MAG: trimeric intracellular cation channel family protein [Eubacteriales bacterium]|nr:trimeric intracellular cation channel family protein [Eubacteriales bacterium]